MRCWLQLIVAVSKCLALNVDLVVPAFPRKKHGDHHHPHFTNKEVYVPNAWKNTQSFISTTLLSPTKPHTFRKKKSQWDKGMFSSL